MNISNGFNRKNDFGCFPHNGKNGKSVSGRIVTSSNSEQWIWWVKCFYRNVCVRWTLQHWEDRVTTIKFIYCKTETIKVSCPHSVFELMLVSWVYSTDLLYRLYTKNILYNFHISGHNLDPHQNEPVHRYIDTFVKFSALSLSVLSSLLFMCSLYSDVMRR